MTSLFSNVCLLMAARYLPAGIIFELLAGFWHRPVCGSAADELYGVLVLECAPKPRQPSPWLYDTPCRRRCDQVLGSSGSHLTLSARGSRWLPQLEMAGRPCRFIRRRKEHGTSRLHHRWSTGYASRIEGAPFGRTSVLVRDLDARHGIGW